MMDILRDIENISDFYIDIMEADMDHVHMMLSITPKYSISAIVRRIKAISTYRIWQLHSDILSKHFWKERTFFSDGYFVCSVGEAGSQVIRKYIEKQGEPIQPIT